MYRSVLFYVLVCNSNLSINALHSLYALIFKKHVLAKSIKIKNSVSKGKASTFLIRSSSFQRF